MVGMHYIWVNSRAAQGIAERLGDGDVINAPALVVASRSGAERPPGVVVRHLGMEVAEGVYEAAIKELVHPGALFGQEAAAILIGLGTVDVYLTVADIVIAADDELRALLAQLGNVMMKLVQPQVLVSLPLLAGRARGEVGVDERHIAKVGADDTALGIALHDAIAKVHGVGGYFRKNSDAAVALLLRGKNVGFVAERFQLRDVYILFIRFDFLQAYNVSGIRSQPGGKSLVHGAADAVDVVRDDAHGRKLIR